MPMTPAKAELLAQLQERQRLDVASRNGLWERYFRGKAERGIGMNRVTIEGNRIEGTPPQYIVGVETLTLTPAPSRIRVLLERAMAQKSVGAVLAIVRQALQILHEDESSGILGKP